MQRRFNNQYFHEFLLRHFDPLAYKYGRRNKASLDSDWDNFFLDEEDRDIVSFYEKNNKPINIEQHDIVSMVMNTKLVYGSLEKARDFQELYEIVAEKFVVDYIGIPGLSALYDEDYPDFEWSMHVNLNFKEHRNSYYRDHFVHEMRNVYMMYSLLNNEYIYYNTMKYLLNPSVGKLSEYICSERNKWHYQYDLYPLEIRELINHNFSGEQYFLPGFEPKDCYFMRYIIYAASAIAGLFHDIGYPIAHCYETQDRAIEFFPPLSVLLNNESVTFSQIQDLLSDTLLFQIVEPKEIKKRFENREHGTLSALLLALHYHKTGRIHSLPIEQQVALEYGIVIIYNHTLDFYYSKKKGETLHYKMQFSRDPLSWLFRLCDDAQEWDREYFEITNTPNLMFCEQCHTPFLKMFDETDYDRKSDAIVRDYLGSSSLPNILAIDNETQKENLGENIANDLSNSKTQEPIFTNPVKAVRYVCRCGIERKHIHDRLSWFQRRQIVTIQACDQVDVIVKKHGANLPVGRLLFDFYYNPYKQLRICSIHHSFSRYRAKDLASDKRFLQMQTFVDELGQGYGDIGLKHNLSPNPYLLKAMIWGEYLKLHPNFETLDQEIHSIETNEKLDLIGKKQQIQNAIKRSANDIVTIVKALYNKSEETESYVSNITANSVYYVVLYYYWQINDSNIRAFAVEEANSISEEYTNGIPHNYNVRYFNDILEEAAQKQIKDRVDPALYSDLYSTKYERYLLEDDEVYATVGRYCDREEPINQVSETMFYRDYFSDMYLYEQLSLYAKMKMKIV